MRFWEVPFNGERWRNSNSHLAMTLEEKGLYFELLTFQWLKGELPEDPALIAKIACVSLTDVARLWSADSSRVRRKFTLFQGRGWVNQELEEIRGHKMRIGKIRSKIGKLGGNSRKTQTVEAIASGLLEPCLSKHCEQLGVSSSSSSSNPREKQEDFNSPRAREDLISNGNNPPDDPAFRADDGWDEFCREFPNDKRIFEAQRFYSDRLMEAPVDSVEHQRIIAGCKRAAAYYRATQTSKQFQEGAVGFLAGKRYLETWGLDSAGDPDQPADVDAIMERARARRRAEQETKNQ